MHKGFVVRGRIVFSALLALFWAPLLLVTYKRRLKKLRFPELLWIAAVRW